MRVHQPSSGLPRLQAFAGNPATGYAGTPGAGPIVNLALISHRMQPPEWHGQPQSLGQAQPFSPAAQWHVKQLGQQAHHQPPYSAPLAGPGPAAAAVTTHVLQQPLASERVLELQQGTVPPAEPTVHEANAIFDIVARGDESEAAAVTHSPEDSTQ